VAPGYFANLIVTSDLTTLPIDMVFYHGRLVGKDRKPQFLLQKSDKQTLTNTVKVKPFRIEALRLKAKGNTAPVIEIVPGQITTKKCTMKVKIENGYIMPDIQRDILKLVVVERHKRTGNIGLGLVKGFGLKKGALAHPSPTILTILWLWYK